MNIVQLARCAFGYHVRDRATVVIGLRTYHGRCRGCGVAMVKRAEGWQIDHEYSD